MYEVLLYRKVRDYHNPNYGLQSVKPLNVVKCFIICTNVWKPIQNTCYICIVYSNDTAILAGKSEIVQVPGPKPNISVTHHTGRVMGTTPLKQRNFSVPHLIIRH